jgi:hypothetical protein
MADGADRLDLLRGRINLDERYQSTRQGRPGAFTIPARDPAEHKAILVAQLDAIWRTVARRDMQDRDPAADHELVVLTPEPGHALAAASLGDVHTGVRVVSVDESTGTVLIDTSRADLPHLRRKIDRFADDTKVKAEDGARAGARAIAPVREVRVAQLEDLAGPLLRAASLGPDEPRWFELACAGGRRARTSETEKSRAEIKRQLAKLQYRRTPQEFVATDRVLFFLRLTSRELRALVAATDCIYELDLAGAAVRDWLLISDEELPVHELGEFRLTLPAWDAPSVVVLDTGLASEHPLLRDAVLSSVSVLPGDLSGGDIHGHGTRMAGVVLHDDLGASLERNEGPAAIWLQSVKILRVERQGTASDDERDFWPRLTEWAAEAAEADGQRRRVFVMAVTAPLHDPPSGTPWSQAVDQLAYNDGNGRLFCVSIGNADVADPVVVHSYPQLNLDALVEDPAQAVNALTVGAFTMRATLPPDGNHNTLTCLAPAGGVSPYTRAGVVSKPVKPDVVFEGGNVAFDGARGWVGAETLSTLTTGKDFARRPLELLWATSCATAHAGRFVARVWAARPELRPETVRGLVVHSAEWTPAMLRQFRNIDQRLALCGYGVPDLAVATACARERATVIVEDEMPNAVFEAVPGERDQTSKTRRIKFFRFPIPDDVLLIAADDGDVELRITLSYFAEPITTRRKRRLGLELSFDVQGADETEDQFREKMNRVLRQEAAKRAALLVGERPSPEVDEPGADGTEDDEPADGADETRTQPDGSATGRQRRSRGFTRYWELGMLRRSRGTVQSDRLRCPAALLAGSKLIAVAPRLGWWDERDDLEAESMQFSLIATVIAPGRDVYTPISQALELAVAPPIEPSTDITIES